MSVSQGNTINHRVRIIFWLGVLNIVLIIIVAATALSFSIVTRNKAMGLKVQADYVRNQSFHARVEMLSAHGALRDLQANQSGSKQKLLASLDKLDKELGVIARYPHHSGLASEAADIAALLQQSGLKSASPQSAATSLSAAETLNTKLEGLLTITDQNAAAAQQHVIDTDFRSRLVIVVVISIGLSIVVWLMSYQSRYLKESFGFLLGTLRENSNRINNFSDQILSVSQALATDTQSQAERLQNSAKTLGDMAEHVVNNAEKATEAERMATDAGQEAKAGYEAMSRMETAIEGIHSAADRTRTIIKTIDEIAFQTNLLALNAAVEAARAGDAGKGFAVVAEEVRNLAQRSTDAARSTTDLIQESMESAEQGVQVSQDAARLLQRINETIGSTGEVIHEVANRATLIAGQIDQVNTDISKVDSMTANTTGEAERVAVISEELSAVTTELGMVMDDLQRGVENRKQRKQNKRSQRQSKSVTQAIPEITKA